MTVPLEIVVALDAAHGIGRDGTIPWRLPADLAHFRRVTTRCDGAHHRNAVIMGRRTWESLPAKHRPLSGRLNLVLSRAGLALPPDVLHACTFEEACAQLAGRSDVERVFVIGGAEVYRRALEAPSCQRLHVTRVEGEYGCDTFFPPFEQRFTKVHASDRQEHDGIGFVFERYER